MLTRSVNFPMILCASLALAAGRSASAQQQDDYHPVPPGSYSDQPLNSGSTPPAPYGNDLLLAQNVPGPFTSYRGPVGAATWTTDLIMSESANKDYYGKLLGDGGTMTDPNKDYQYVPFSGTGPTGAGVNGGGKHTENTLNDINRYWKHATVFYQYYWHITFYDDTGTSYTKSPQPGSIGSYQF